MINRVIILGRVGKDPEIRSSSAGSSIGTFSVATTESWRDKNGEKQEKTEWHRIVVFNDKLVSGVVEKYIKKGSLLYIEGSLSTRKYQDKDGAEKYTTEIVIKGYSDTLKIISSQAGGGSGEKHESQSFSSSSESQHGNQIEEDEIPF